MKTRIMYLSLFCMVAVFTIFNISVSETKNGKKLSIFNSLLQLKPLATIAEAEDFPENFPEDPWEGSGSGARIRSVSNYYIYAYAPSNSNPYYDEYVYPVTEVKCEGSGEIACTFGLYIGNGVYTKTVTEEQKNKSY